VSHSLFSERYPFAFLVVLSDLSMIILSAFITYYFKVGDFNLELNYKVLIVLTSLLIICLSSFSGVYLSWRGHDFRKQLLKVVSVWCLAFACLLVLLFFGKQSESFSRVWLVSWFISSLFLVCFYKISLFLILKKLRQAGKNIKHVVIVGKSNIVNKMLETSENYPEYGFKISGILGLASYDNENESFERLIEKLENNGYHELWLCLPLSESAKIKMILYRLRHSTLEIRFFPSLDEMCLLNHKSSSLMGFHSINLSCSPMDEPNEIIKFCEDILLASLILVIIFIPCLVIAALIKLTSSGPVLFKQKRHGLGKKEFMVYKFRSMSVHTEQVDIVTQATKNDPRITPIGAFLRKTSLDELPQFINVLQGKMSIVGPRPHALAHNEYYKDLVESYMWRHKVKPGITGWAQVNGHRGETDTLEKMKNRVEHDLWYLENWSLVLDLKIIFLTILHGFCHKNAY